MAQFIQFEKVVEKQKNIKYLFRLMWELPYFKWCFIPFLILTSFCSGLPQYFLWVASKYVNNIYNPPLSDHVTHTILGFEVTVPVTLSFLGYLVLAAFITRFVSWTLFELTGNWSTQKIHFKMMRGIFGTKTTFFDENPSGRLINRIIGDYSKLNYCIIEMGDFISALSDIAFMTLLIWIANPIPALFVIPLICSYFYLQYCFAPMLSHALELQSIAMGDVIHRETDLIEGRDVFCLYEKEHNLFERLHVSFIKVINIGLLSAKLHLLSDLWKSFITITFSVLVYLFLTIGIHTQKVDAIFAAIIMTAILNLSDMFGFLTWSVTDLGKRVANVRRIFQYVDLPKEENEETNRQADAILNTEKPKGDICFKNYTMSYRKESTIILNDMSLTLPKGKKIGVIGRTGAGKTTLFQSLFRMVYVHNGDIMIGNTSIYSLDINMYRSLFGIVPQDPYLFEGSIKFNLVGDNRSISDSKLLSALDKVQINFNLDDHVSEGGKDYSIGERQLLCLARVLIADKPFILMDEPTSSVDTITDAKIQKVLETQLNGRTLITIAHRLESLWNYDLIIELKKGQFYRQGLPKDIIPQII